MIHQELLLLPHLSIAENVFVGRYPRKGVRIDRAAMVAKAQEQMTRLGLDLPATRRVEGLSTAAQQLVEIGKALALNARLLILDEPTAALGGAETKLLFKQIENLKADGVGIIYISHRLEEIRRIADRIVVMRDGQKVSEFERGDVPVRTIVEAMVGRKLERMFPEIPKPGDETVLGARSSIYDIIVELAAKGVSVIVVSSDLEEVLGVSNRILVMSHGRQTGILDRSDANDVSVMELATG